ncbi:HNH endonuclease signature motif containing protein [Speluncibacter jeojiensis]|uniref:HNH endonuclease n=1 Tax=Speluncibacter jeojiensis TaxID=2710754 RepID=A0A9X4RET4_9ACTN|nr:HNH endonuclease [Corynebacteriales bacterium D3-21]
MSEAQLVESVPELTRRIHELEAARVRLVGEMDHRKVAPDKAHPSLKNWLASNPVGLLSPGDAARIVDLAKALRAEPEVAAAYKSGGLRAELATAIAAFCQDPPKGLSEDLLPAYRKVLIENTVHGACGITQVRSAITRLRDHYAQTPPAEDVERNEFYASATLNGRVVIKGDVDAETGEMLLRVLSALSALSAPVPGPGPDGEPDPRTAARRRADGFAEMVRRCCDHGVGPVEGGEKPHVTVTVNLKDLHHCDEGDNSRNVYARMFGDDTGPSMPWLGGLTRAATRRLACDCIVTPVIINQDGVPLELGRRHRLVTPGLRKALQVRDRCCAFPGCGRPAAWTDAHHIKHWADGGPTDLTNTVLLCRYHHRLIHHCDWDVIMGQVPVVPATAFPGPGPKTDPRVWPCGGVSGTPSPTTEHDGIADARRPCIADRDAGPSCVNERQSP